MDGPRSGSRTRANLDDAMAHFGVRGMRWGTRRGHTSSPASEDSQRATAAGKKAKKSTNSLSNKELQDLVTRMNLERQYSTLSTQGPNMNAGGKFVHEVINSIGKQQAISYGNKLVAKQLAKRLGNG